MNTRHANPFLRAGINQLSSIGQKIALFRSMFGGREEVYARMFNKRCAGYDALGYTILLPANALPGWPVEVPLPVDAKWKSDYSASVRRLIRDGVDAPLARLFVRVTLVPHEGADRGEGAEEQEWNDRFHGNIGIHPDGCCRRGGFTGYCPKHRKTKPVP